MNHFRSEGKKRLADLTMNARPSEKRRLVKWPGIPVVAPCPKSMYVLIYIHRNVSVQLFIIVSDLNCPAAI